MKTTRKINRIISIVLAVAMIMSFSVPTTIVKAATSDLVISESSGGTLTDGTDYVYTSGILTILKGGEYTIGMSTGVTSTSDVIKIGTSDAVTITLSNVNISASGNAAIDVSGNSATILFSGTNTLYSSDNPAIHVSSGSLTISGDTSDTVNATTSSQGAAIGGGYTEEFSGKINIVGGTVNATNNYSGYDGAGIGSGNWGVFSGSINISGGRVTGSSTTGYAAGIGSGSRGVFSGNINISGGTATGYSGDGSGAGAGIGAGRYGNFTGSINITDGTVTGYSKYGAGIGSGAYANSLSGSINIEGGTVSGSSERGAGIGAGEGVNCSGNINISGGTVNASATSGAGIGVGNYSGTLSGNINISGGYMVFSSASASALGAGETSTISGTINITGGYFGDSSFTAGEYGTGKIYGCDIADGYLVCANADTSTKDEYSCCVTLSCSHSYTDGFCTTCGAYEPATINSEGIYEISNAGQLFWFAALVNGINSITYNSQMFNIESITAAVSDASAVLTNDIDLSVTTSPHANIEWIPIGSKTTPFSGIFDGDGYTVSGMSITTTSDYMGLFGYVTGTVKDMTVGGSINVSGSEMYVGGIVGTVYDGILSDLTSTVTINGTDDEKGTFGGVVATAEGTSGGATVERCTYSGSLTASGVLDCIGGIVGYISVATINDCLNSGNVDTTGGTSGKSVTTGIYTSGIVGYCNNSNAVITNCLNLGTISDASSNTGVACYTGAIIGRINSKIGSLSNCYYLSGTADAGYGINGSSVDADSNIAFKTADEFASGEVTYLLNESVSGGTTWYQNIDNGETVDIYPVLNSSHGTVYYGTDCAGIAIYSNSIVPAAEHDYEAVVTDPTCTEGGYTTYTCSICGDSYVDDKTAATGHSWDEGEVTTEATCTEKGVKTYTCTVCGETKTEAISETGHTAGEAVIENEIAETCMTDGSYESVVYCVVCSAEISRETVTVPATGHSYTSVVTEPTCTEDGYTTHTCTTCGHSYTDSETAATGHSYESVVTDPTCTEKGYTTHTCTTCGHSYTDNETEATGHSWDEGVITTEATCTAEGVITYTCTVCGETKTVAISATGHTAGETVIENVVAATCTTDGSYDSVVYCTVCGAELSRDTIIVPATGHNYTSVVIDPTCTEEGYTTHTCTTCGHSYTDSETEATGHTHGEAVKENNVEATCTTDGSYDSVTYCTVCGAELSRETITVSATGHSYTSVVTEPTCTEDGYTTHTCTTCGHSYTDSETAATGHSYEEVVTDPTCTEGGYTTHTCSVCGDTYVDSKTAATGHNWDEGIITTEATCTAEGVITYTCTVCGETKTVAIFATGHTAGEAVIENEVAATCTTDGSYDSVVYCTVCCVEISRETITVPATGHNYTSVVTDPTCTEEGYTTHTCSVCGDTYTDSKTEATGHSWDEGVITTETACTTEGVITYTCTVCGETKTVAISATGHTAGEAVIENEVAATCTTDGSYDSVVYCTVCGAELSRDTITVPATGHNYTSVVTEPTCTEEGYTTHTCSICGDTYTDSETEATGHTYEVTEVVASTYTQKGYTVYTCTGCGDSYEADYTDIRIIDGTDENLTVKTVVQELTEVPEGLREIYESVEELIADLESRVLVSQGYTEDNTLVIDVVLQYRINGGEWINATADNFPSDGITVTLDYPDGTDSSYDFMVVHMFTVTSERLGITAGEVEMPEVTKTDEGIVITLNGLSPVMISWKAATTEVATTSENDEPASEEDEPAGVEEDTTGAEETPASEEAASSSENDVSTTEKEAATTSENEATTSEDDNSNESAQTGDSGKLAIWFTVISLIGLTGARTYRRRKRVN